jgi:hypothetical protein
MQSTFKLHIECQLLGYPRTLGYLTRIHPNLSQEGSVIKGFCQTFLTKRLFFSPDFLTELVICFSRHFRVVRTDKKRKRKVRGNGDIANRSDCIKKHL